MWNKQAIQIKKHVKKNIRRIKFNQSIDIITERKNMFSVNLSQCAGPDRQWVRWKDFISLMNFASYLSDVSSMWKLKSPVITSLDSFIVEDEKSLNSFKKNLWTRWMLNWNYQRDWDPFSLSLPETEIKRQTFTWERWYNTAHLYVILLIVNRVSPIL